MIRSNWHFESGWGAAALAALAAFGGCALDQTGAPDTASPAGGPLALGGPAAPPPGPALRAAVAAPGRPERDRARDPDRKPAEVLAFFGVGPGQKVAELMAGTGFYVEILSEAVGEEGLVVAHNSPFVLQRFAEEPFTERLARLRLDNVVRLDAPPEQMGLPPDLDAVLLVRFYHDFYWQNVDRTAVNRQVFEALRPGGVYGIVDHHAEAGSGARDVETLHRVDAELVKQEILDAGFEWGGESHALRRPEDTRTTSVFIDSGERRDQTDRFVFLFRKPL